MFCLPFLILLSACDRIPRVPRPVATATAPHRGDVMTGRVVAVSDGDTLTVLDGSLAEHKVRLAGIDTPEKAQDFGKVAKYELSQRVFQKTVEVQVLARDRYGRSVARVFVEGQDVGLGMLQAGLAWFYRDYQKDLPPETREAYDRAEARARAAGEGLWRDSDPTPPWEWRKAKRRR